MNFGNIVTQIALYSQRPLPGGFQLVDISLDDLFALEPNHDECLALGHLADLT